MQYLKLNNGVHMPSIMMGTSICDLQGNTKDLMNKLESAIIYGKSLNQIGFDTSRDYQNEPLLGRIFNKMIKNHICSREDIFITTKVGNSQQKLRNMSSEIDISLKSLKLEYIDLWLLHWPLPEYWLDNWEQLLRICNSGKVRAVGIANCRERHIKMIKDSGLNFPHVVQVEYHPFRTISKFKQICDENNIQLEAYSANCLMLPFVRKNAILNTLACKYNRSITQIIMRWHVQQGTIPIFRSFNLEHIYENVNIFDFELSSEDMLSIYSLNQDYKFHPESLNCPGY